MDKVYVNGDLLKNARKRLTLTQGEMATFVSLKRGDHMSEPLYQKIEQGTRSVDLKTAKLLSRLVDIPMSLLFYFKKSDIDFASNLKKKD